MTRHNFANLIERAEQLVAAIDKWRGMDAVCNRIDIIDECLLKMDARKDVLVQLEKMPGNMYLFKAILTVDEAKSKGIPVISYDRLMLNSSVDLYVTINSQKVGEYMATGFLTKTQAKKFFAILGAEEDFNMALVKEGIVQKLQKVNKKLDYIYYTFY